MGGIFYLDWLAVGLEMAVADLRGCALRGCGVAGLLVGLFQIFSSCQHFKNLFYLDAKAN